MERHGHRTRRKRSPEYIAWVNMNDRCYNKSHKRYADYGGRGISVCERWRSSFLVFLLDMGKRPSPDHSLDRYPNNDGHYEPGNVRWATRKEQDFNKRPKVAITYKGVTKSLAAWSREFGVSPETIANRHRLGHDIATPIRNLKNS